MTKQYIMEKKTIVRWFNKIEIINTLIFNQYSSKIIIGASDKDHGDTDTKSGVFRIRVSQWCGSDARYRLPKL